MRIEGQNDVGAAACGENGGDPIAMIEEALAQVNPAFRAAVVLRDMEDLSYDEIAEILQVSLGTVKSRILRGREALRKVLANRLNPERPYGDMVHGLLACACELDHVIQRQRQLRGVRKPRPQHAYEEVDCAKQLRVRRR